MSQDFQLGDDMATLSDLAGLNMDDVNEVRGFGLPRGLFVFAVKEGKLTVIETANGNKPVAQFACEVRRVLDITDTENAPDDPATLVGKVHNESFFLNSDDQAKLVESMGRVKAFLADMGVNMQGVSFQDAIVNSAGTEFAAPVIRVKDKRDPDREYINLKHDKIKPAQEAAA